MRRLKVRAVVPRQTLAGPSPDPSPILTVGIANLSSSGFPPLSPEQLDWWWKEFQHHEWVAWRLLKLSDGIVPAAQYVRQNKTNNKNCFFYYFRTFHSLWMFPFSTLLWTMKRPCQRNGSGNFPHQGLISASWRSEFNEIIPWRTSRSVADTTQSLFKDGCPFCSWM